MASSDTTQLAITPRDLEGSRATRRLRRSGRVPGILYGGDGEPVPFSADQRELRIALNSSGAVVELSLEGKTQAAVLKEFQRHPVRGEMMHVDFVRVRMDVAIQTTVVVELEGVDESPGTSEGGVLEQTLREVTVEALPGDVPETIAYDASGLEAGATVTVADLKAPANVTIVDDPEAVVASITLPKLEVETDDVETETALVGEDGEPLPEGAEGADGDDSPDASGSGDGEQPDTTEQ